MKLLFRLFGIWLVLGCAWIAAAQSSGPKIDRIDIKYVGPSSVSEEFIRANIRTKPGSIYRANSTQDDIKALYGTGQFYNIRITTDQGDNGLVLTYIVQVKPRLSDIQISGNKKLKASKIKKKITSKVGQPLDEQKLFSDSQAIQKLYQKSGYPETKVKYVVNIDEAAGRGTATFEVSESPKIKIEDIEFVGATAFSQKELRKQMKTKRKWMFSWLTGSDLFKDDQFQDDKDKIVAYYREHGYLDFEIKDVKFEHPTEKQMVIRFYVYEGRQYHVGSIKFTGNKLFSAEDIHQGMVGIHDYEHRKSKIGPNGFEMDVGDIFSPSGLEKDIKGVEDFYGSKGYIEVVQGPNLRINRIPNIDTGTMDLEFQIDEGQKNYVEKIDIRGNVKTKDKVIRRELAIAPGEVFNMVQVETSKKRLEGLQYFDKVDARPEPTDPPIAGHQNLIVSVEEKNTGSFSIGAGFSSVDALVGFAEIKQGNFDLFNPPTFTGAGQKFRLAVQLGTQRQDYELEFTEPWFLNRKLSLDVDLYHHELDFVSLNDLYNERSTGMRVSLTRALWTDFLIGSISYTIEDVGISLNQSTGIPTAITSERGDHLLNRFGASLAYDTRNSVELPNHGQRSEITTEFVGGDRTFYKMEVKTAWYFPGLFKGHVLEVGGRAGTAQGLGSGDVPFYERYYLGGLYSLRGFKYRSVSPRESGFTEPIGGDSYWFGSLEYSIPIFEKENGPGIRFAMFYDAGSVGAQSYSFSGNFDDNWGVGFRIYIPHLGPLRFDYGIPIHHDSFNSDHGQFQFGAGYTRQF